MKIKKIEINNFKAINFASYEFNGDLNIITGDNGIGKTSTLEAISWVLTNSTLDNTAQELKMGIIPNNSPISTEVSVKIVFDNDFEVEKKLIRKSNKNGELSGTTTSYYLNGLAEKSTVAVKKINDVLGLNDFNTFISDNKLNFNGNALALNPEHIKTLVNNDLRKVVINMIGDIDEYELIAKVKESKKDIAQV